MVQAQPTQGTRATTVDQVDYTGPTRQHELQIIRDRVKKSALKDLGHEVGMICRSSEDRLSELGIFFVKK